MPSVAALAVASGHTRIGRNVKESADVLHLQLQRETLETQLTTTFPAENDRLFDKELPLLMINR